MKSNVYRNDKFIQQNMSLEIYFNFPCISTYTLFTTKFMSYLWNIWFINILILWTDYQSKCFNFKFLKRQSHIKKTKYKY